MQTADRRVSLAITIPVPRDRPRLGAVSGTLSNRTGRVRSDAADPDHTASTGTTSTRGKRFAALGSTPDHQWRGRRGKRESSPSSWTTSSTGKEILASQPVETEPFPYAC